MGQFSVGELGQFNFVADTRLPNGVELALEADDAVTVQAVLTALAMLRCGA